MEYKIKPPDYKTVKQWQSLGKMPIDDSVVEKCYVTQKDGSLFLKDGVPQVYEYVSPDKVKDIEIIKETYTDDGKIPAFRDNLSFLSNMYICDIPYDVNGKEYLFHSVENAYQSLKNPESIFRFISISPSEAKILGRTIQCREDWDLVKDNIMKELLTIKFTNNPELLSKLCKCDFQIAERNYWKDFYWGICNGIGQNKLGNLLEEIKCNALGIPYISSQEKAFNVGQELLQKQNDLSANYAYKKLPDDFSYMVRKEYATLLPDFYMHNNQNQELHSIDGVLIARGWNRVVIGDYGAFIEIEPDMICKENFIIKPGEEYRIYDSKYSKNVKYHWYIPKSGYETKLYYQQAGVTYADYKAGKWYVSPHETLEGMYISNHIPFPITRTVEKTLSAELNQALNKPINKIDIPDGIVVFDVETTGVSKSDELLQISIYNKDGYELINTFVKPVFKQEWNEATRINHITPQMVANAPLPSEIASKVRDIFESSKVVVGFNVSFDVRMVKQCLGISIDKNKVYDVAKDFKKINLPSHKLEDAVKYYCPDKYSEFCKGAHDSSVDTKLTLDIYLKQLSMQNEKQMTLDLDLD